MSNKIFRNLDEQLEILRAKGLTITDDEKTKEVILRENYFFISGYRHVFLKSHKDRKFVEGSTFEELYALFIFDRKFRNTIFKNLLIIENNIKSVISYQLSKKYGVREKDYLKPRNFTDDAGRYRQVNDIINKMKRQIRLNGRQHTATMHYLSNYGYIPLWVLVKVLSFGIVSELFSILKNEDQLNIAEIYDIDLDCLCIYMPILANYRNLCAHEDILYEHKTQRVIPNNKIHYELNIPMMDDEFIFGKNDLFALIIILKEMLSFEEFQELIFEIGYELDILAGKLSSISLARVLDKMGFPENWRDIENI